MNKGVRLTLSKAGEFCENTNSKNEGSLGENVTFDLSVSALKARI